MTRRAGFCQFVVETRAWEEVNEEMVTTLSKEMSDVERSSLDPVVMASAVEAMARGQPRPGHTVLGDGTFNAARPAWEALIQDYVQIQSFDPECRQSDDYAPPSCECSRARHSCNCRRFPAQVKSRCTARVARL